MAVATFIETLFRKVFSFSDRVWDIFFTPVREFIERYVPFELPDYGWLDYTVFALMLDVGFLFFVGFTFVKWIVNLVT